MVGNESQMLLQKALRAVPFVIVIGFTYVLVQLLSAPGASNSRLLFFGLLLGLAYLGLGGLVIEIPVLTILCGTLLLVVGFTQFVLFIYILPTAMTILVYGIASFVPQPQRQ